MDEKGWKQSKLSEITGQSTSKISEYVRAKVMPSAESAVQIALALGVNPEWLVLGIGKRESRELYSDDFGFTSPPDFSVPLLDTRLAAGSGVTAAENVIGNINMPPEVMGALRRDNTKGLVMMQAAGDSMYPTISDRSYVLIDTNARNLVEGIYAFRLENDLKVKRLRTVGLGDIEVISDNPIYPPDRIIGSERQHFDIIGRAIWSGTLL
ncbi:S24 family peptidase [Asticcacaulis sp. AND118]|uniref:LexA family transcriptional regulator n=1 Tax=Asticcacaulis sp. AND118 TaxID=2840468 RepID=UPI001CFF8CD6|nr:S24 family peptidase [Asticcacaulis sp. AND118]UDF02993.1 helix-turn-helix domain-containing protein [Asticcacaulis sp. AND118]